MEDTSKQDILEAIGAFAEQVDSRFEHIESAIVGIKGEIVGMKGEIVGIKDEIIGIKNQMVTKSYLDDKLADLKGDMIVFVRREDAKLLAKLA